MLRFRDWLRGLCSPLVGPRPLRHRAGTSSLVAQWGLYNWFPEHGLHLVHPDDLAALTALMPQGRVLRCIEEDAAYLTLEYGGARFRVKPDLFQPVPAPRHQIGEQVRVRRNALLVTATICDITWHFKRRKAFYNVIVDGRRSGKWHWDEDIV